MKKVFYFIAVASLVFMTSCSKECTCTATTTGMGEVDMPAVTTTFETKADCSEGNSTVSAGEMTVKTVCK